jgi:hypothetical protein
MGAVSASFPVRGGQLWSVTTAEGERQDLLRQPAVQLFELVLVAHVTQVIIDDRHVANPGGKGLFGQLHRQPGPSQRIAQAAKSATLATEGVAEEVADLPELVARQSDRASNTILQSKMAKPLG